MINVVNSYILINLLTLLQEYNGLQKSFDRFKEILKEQEDPVSKSVFIYMLSLLRNTNLIN